MNLVSIGIFGIMFLAVLGLISNTSEESVIKIQDQMFLMNCPMPIYNGVATLHTIEGYALNYTVTYASNIKADFNGTKFICTASDGLLGASTTIYAYGASTFWGTLPYGWIGYISDTLGNVFSQLQAFFTLVSYFVTPENFNILGYTSNDLGGIILMLCALMYAFCYIAIGALLYKVISPFAGVG